MTILYTLVVRGSVVLADDVTEIPDKAEVDILEFFDECFTFIDEAGNANRDPVLAKKIGAATAIASASSILISWFGGTIIDIVSGDLETPEKKSEAVSKVNRTILGIFLIVIIGSICTTLRAWLFYSASERIVAALRKNLFSHLVNQVAQVAVRAALQSSGQNCVGAERFYVHRDVFSAFVAEVVKIVQSVMATWMIVIVPSLDFLDAFIIFGGLLAVHILVVLFTVWSVDFKCFIQYSKVKDINHANACKITPAKFCGSKEVVPLHFRKLVGSSTEEIYFDFRKQCFIYSNEKKTFCKLPYPSKETFAYYLKSTGHDWW